MGNKRTAAILVLGDLNRSPRMLNHSKAISQIMEEIDEVSLIGFNGGELRSDIMTDKKIKIYYIPERINNSLKKLPRIFFILSALVRIVLQLFFLLYILLFKIPKPSFLILQNPPGIPAIYICSLVCFLRRSTFIIDWHNYGYTIMEVNGRNRCMTLIARIYEKVYGKCADLNFCVSNSMKKHLKYEMKVDAINLPDKAMKNVFKRLNLNESHDLLNKYDETNDKFTEVDYANEAIVKSKVNRPILMISSTSWTPDEDFDLLLDSLIETEKKLLNACDEAKIKKVILIITGRGPLRHAFMRKVNQTHLRIFEIKSIWLESDDYPKLLGSADLGICLHYSSSGFDLPMKVVDMFSAQLPVASYDYETVHELVKKNFNGFLFKNKEELSKILSDIILEYSLTNSNKIIDQFRKNLENFSVNDWITQWKEVAYDPIVKKSKLKLHVE
jgi:beta-1,4-mannosyltransferase